MGSWLTETRDGVVRVYRCGNDGGICARVIGMEYEGQEPVDIWHRPKCGLTIMNDLRPRPDGSYEGQILDPDSGKSYDARLHLDPSGILKLRGYIGLPIFGATQDWTRFHGKLGPACHLTADQAH